MAKVWLVGIFVGVFLAVLVYFVAVELVNMGRNMEQERKEVKKRGK